MSSRPAIQKFAALLAVIPLSWPGWMQPVFAETTTPVVLATSGGTADARLLDIVLRPGNVLAGELVDSEGMPQADQDVFLSFGRHEIARGTTNKSGKFLIEVPRGGVYLVTSGSCVKVVRTWTSTAAPPAARDHLTLSPATTVIRGQNYESGTNPITRLLFLGGIAAAIAIPIALSNNGDGHRHTSTDSSPPPTNEEAEVAPASP